MNECVLTISYLLFSLLGIRKVAAVNSSKTPEVWGKREHLVDTTHTYSVQGSTVESGPTALGIMADMVLFTKSKKISEDYK